jgi:hypothetical protein
MKPQMPRPFDYGHSLGHNPSRGGLPQAHIPPYKPRPQAHIPENGPSLGGGTAPMQPRPGAGDPRMMLAQKMAAVQKQKMYGSGGMSRSHQY